MEKASPEIISSESSTSSELVVGKVNLLKAVRSTANGYYLTPESSTESSPEVLLPNRFVPEDFKIGDLIKVFVSFDSEDRLYATTEEPLAQVGDFQVLKVVAIERVGAFLDWGLSKDLLLPFSEQEMPSPQVDEEILVRVYLDSSGRIAASMKLGKFLTDECQHYKAGDAVSLRVAAKTDLGYKTIVDQKHWGVLYFDSVFQNLEYGDSLPGFVKRIREDGRLDICLTKEGHQAAVETVAPKILELLVEKNGFLPINDKTSPEFIYKLFGVSKKKYKIALGSLYKERLIQVKEDGIRLAKAETPAL